MKEQHDSGDSVLSICSCPKSLTQHQRVRRLSAAGDSVPAYIHNAADRLEFVLDPPVPQIHLGV